MTSVPLWSIVWFKEFTMQWIKSNAGVFTLGVFVMANIAYIESRMGSMENRIGDMENRLNNKIEREISKVETEISKIETEISKIEVEIKELRNLIITLIAENKTNKANGRKPASQQPTPPF